MQSTNDTTIIDLSAAVDTAWILTSTVMILFMQSGFALLESGACQPKNFVNVMLKNIMDVVLGGSVYWAIGYGLQFGMSKGTNPFCGIGNFFLHGASYNQYLHFVFQLSFSSTAITIVSAAVAERCSYNAYCIFCALFCVVYCIPSGWIWRENGFLSELGAIDYCGSTAIHLVGGIASLVAAIYLKPRKDRYKDGWQTPAPNPGNPVMTIFGAQLLWWGFLFFNSGSTFGLANGLWKLASRAFTNTIISSVSGGAMALLYCHIFLKYVNVNYVVNGILTALVSICGCAAIAETYDAFYIGCIAAIVCILITQLCDRLQIDDPVGAIAVHAGGGVWGTLVVGLCTDFDESLAASVTLSKGQRGLFKSGDIRLFGKQVVALITLTAWTVAAVAAILYCVDRFMKVRMSKEQEAIGADLWTHGMPPPNFELSTLLDDNGNDATEISSRMRIVGYKDSAESKPLQSA